MSGSSICVAVDARELPGPPSGDRSYMLGVLRELLELGSDCRFLLCYQADPRTGLEDEAVPQSYEARHLGARPGWLWTPWAWPRLLRAERVDVAFAQYLVPPLSPCPTVVTIHDVSFLAHPEWFPRRQVRIMRRLIPLSARRATRIITGSEHAAGEIAALCRVPRRKVAVIPYAAEARFSPGDRGEARARVAKACDLAEPYVLAVGAIHPRKNLARLVEAFALVAPSHPELRLALVGGAAWDAEEVDERVRACGLAERVAFCGRVPDDVLPDLYRAAELLVYPSLYEGFGLPPLEAMSCGTPVVASNTTSIPEVVGEAAILVDPLDVDRIAGGIQQVLADAQLRQRLSHAGLERARQFTWRRAAAEHLALLRELAS